MRLLKLDNGRLFRYVPFDAVAEISFVSTDDYEYNIEVCLKDGSIIRLCDSIMCYDVDEVMKRYASIPDGRIIDYRFFISGDYVE